jgi:Iron-containing redox enzyme
LTTTPSRRLRRKIDLVIGPFADAWGRLLAHPRIARLWPEYLLTDHAIIRATVPLTVAAMKRAAAREDPMCAALADYLAEHVDEEKGHDDMLLEDLEALGVQRQVVTRRMPSPTVAQLVGAQYYWIEHHHPIAFLGFVAVMEGFPPTPALIATLRARTGLPAAAFRTYEEHGRLDPGHRDHLDELLDSLGVTPEHEEIIGLSALSTVALIPRTIDEILASSDEGVISSDRTEVTAIGR